MIKNFEKGCELIKLEELRFASRVGLEDFASQLDISVSTLTRIEIAERRGEKHHLSHVVAYRLVESLKKVMKRDDVVLEELAGVALVPPRSGRPKRKVEENHV